MKKHWWLINLVVCLLIVGLTLFGVTLYLNYKSVKEFNKKYTFDIDNVRELTFLQAELIDNDYKSFTTSDRDEIEVFKKCVQKVRENIESTSKDKIGPAHIYFFSVTFKDNDYAQEFFYYVNVTDQSDPDPLTEFFSLPSVIEKMNGN